MDKHMPSITVCCATYGGAERIDECFSSIYRKTEYSGDVHLSLLESGSPDQSIRRIAKTVAAKFGARFIQHESHRGLAASWNNLSRDCSTKYIMMIHDDMQVIDPHWLTAFVFFVEENERDNIKFGPVDLCTVASTDKHDVNRTGGHITPAPAFHYDMSLACFGFSRACFDEIGGFWEDTMFYYEDTAFLIDACRVGRYPVKLGIPAVHHDVSQSAVMNPQLLEIEIPPQVRLEIIQSPETYKQYEKYTIAAGPGSCDDFGSWTNKMLAMNPRASLSRYMFCKRYSLPVSIEHRHDGAYKRFVYPLENSWSKLSPIWLDSTSGNCQTIGSE